MARYIDADLLLKDIDKSVVFSVRNGKNSPEFRGAKKILDQLIKHISAADVVEVKHGKWTIKRDEYDCEYLVCSCCAECFYDGDNDTVDRMPKYCPECGAKMDGERRETDGE